MVRILRVGKKYTKDKLSEYGYIKGTDTSGIQETDFGITLLSAVHSPYRDRYTNYNCIDYQGENIRVKRFFEHVDDDDVEIYKELHRQVNEDMNKVLINYDDRAPIFYFKQDKVGYPVWIFKGIYNKFDYVREDEKLVMDEKRQIVSDKYFRKNRTKRKVFRFILKLSPNSVLGN